MNYKTDHECLFVCTTGSVFVYAHAVNSVSLCVYLRGLSSILRSEKNRTQLILLFSLCSYIKKHKEYWVEAVQMNKDRIITERVITMKGEIVELYEAMLFRGDLLARISSHLWSPLPCTSYPVQSGQLLDNILIYIDPDKTSPVSSLPEVEMALQKFMPDFISLII